VDIYHDEKTAKWLVNHNVGYGGENLGDWLKHAGIYEKLKLIILDIKTPCCDTAALQKLIDTVRKSGLNPHNTMVVYETATALDCVKKIWSKLNETEAIATDYLSVPEDVLKKLKQKTDRFHANYWYANGIASSLPKLGLYDSIKKAVWLRDHGKKIQKVYAWTFQSAQSFQEYLLLNVDALIVEKNFIAEAKLILNDFPFLKLAS
jgi:hypothetical protein